MLNQCCQHSTRPASGNLCVPAPRPCRASGVGRTRVTQVQKTRCSGSRLWQDFVTSVSGEWEGVTCTFAPDGKPQPLPEHYVPGAFRDWGVELYDWQSQCSTLALDEGTLSHRIRRMLPTVGCEADAVAYTEEAQTLWQPASRSKGLQARTVMADGSYFSGRPSLSEDHTVNKLEFCFAVPGTPPTRIRMIVHINRNQQSGCWQASQYEVHSERFEAPYQGGIDQLLGCGGGSTGFAEGALTREQDAAALGWQPVSGWVYSSEGSAGGDPVAWEPERPLSKLEGDVSMVLLPMGLFARVSSPPAGANATTGTMQLGVEAGLVQLQDKRTVARAVYVDSLLSSFSWVLEKRS